jgi:hypothetical protein
MKARVSNLHKTEAEWALLNSWIPEAGELVVYDPDHKYSYARLKVGDGKRTLQDLDFFIESATAALMQKHNYSEVIDSGRITEYTK